MTFKRIILGIIFCSLSIATVSAADQTDHPLLTRYPGTEVISKKVEAYGEYKLMVGFDEKHQHVAKALEGKLTRIVYRSPKERSTLEVFRNYQKALKTAGAKTIFTCEMDECGPGYTRSLWNRFNGLFTASDGDPRYLSAELKTDTAQVYIGLMVAKTRSQLDIVEMKPMQEGLVTLDAKALEKGIIEDGKVSVYGILFDTDKALIKAASKPALTAIAELLNNNEALNVYIVGHTDMTASLSHNKTLSQQRAQAVVTALINDYKITATRLEAHGVGPLSPVASNKNEAGKSKNRRVELVEK